MEIQCRDFIFRSGDHHLQQGSMREIGAYVPVSRNRVDYPVLVKAVAYFDQDMTVWLKADDGAKVCFTPTLAVALPAGWWEVWWRVRVYVTAGP
jgi:hypothetical protein